jgi:osmotically-inducible protein OsmY
VSGPPIPPDGTPDYVAEYLRAAFTTDGRVHEQGLDVTVVGSTIVLRGTVPTPAQRDAITEVAHDLAPQAEIVNDIEVTPNPEPRDAEELG